MGWDVEVEGLDQVQASLDELGEETHSRHIVKSDVHYAVYVEFGTQYMSANAALRMSILETMTNLDIVVADATSVSEMTEAIAESIAGGWRRDVWVDTGKLKRSITVEEV